jgi:hypothetical protein
MELILLFLIAMTLLLNFFLLRRSFLPVLHKIGKVLPVVDAISENIKISITVKGVKSTRETKQLTMIGLRRSVDFSALLLVEYPKSEGGKFYFSGDLSLIVHEDYDEYISAQGMEKLTIRCWKEGKRTAIEIFCTNQEYDDLIEELEDSCDLHLYGYAREIKLRQLEDVRLISSSLTISDRDSTSRTYELLDLIEFLNEIGTGDEKLGYEKLGELRAWKEYAETRVQKVDTN